MADTPLAPVGAVVRFIWDRLPLNEGDRQTLPSLAEDWFVEDALATYSPFAWRGLSPAESHRKLYRYATSRAWSEGRYGSEPARFMLHQMVLLVPVLVAQAGKGLRHG